MGKGKQKYYMKYYKGKPYGLNCIFDEFETLEEITKKIKRENLNPVRCVIMKGEQINFEVCFADTDCAVKN